MERLFSDKIVRWLLPVLLILFILVVLTLPAVVNVSYAGRWEAPHNELSYSGGRLFWDPATPVDKYGVATMDLFYADYDNVLSADGKDVVAPGTVGHNIVRLRNMVRGEVTYTAVLFRIRTDDRLKVEPSLYAHNSKPTKNYLLPNGVDHTQVIQAVTGKLEGSHIVDFDLSWKWEFDESEEQNAIDNILGTKAEPDMVTVGLYIMIEDDNSFYAPKSGDDNHVGVYAVLMALSLVLLVLLVWEKRRIDEETSPEEAECQ